MKTIVTKKIRLNVLEWACIGLGIGLVIGAVWNLIGLVIGAVWNLWIGPG